MKDEVEESHKEIKGIQKEYITILGIFAAIMLAFVGAFTFSTSVLNNLGKTGTLELVAVAIVIGLVFVLLISILIDFLRDINDKVVCDKNGKKKWNKKKPKWIIKENENWEGDYIVKYWSPEWKNIIKEYQKKLDEIGVDGYLLDTVDTYQYFEENYKKTLD